MFGLRLNPIRGLVTKSVSRGIKEPLILIAGDRNVPHSLFA